MAMAITLQEYLEHEGVDYDIVAHAPTDDSSHTAAIAHIPGRQLAKSVMLEDEHGRYLLAVIPASHYVDLGELHRQFNMRLGLATESDVGEMFDDCELGAIPPIGDAYGINVILDDSLEDCADVYFEAGDHTGLVHVSGRDFRQIMSQARHGRFSRHA